LVGIPGNSHFFHVIHLKMPGMNIVFLGACWLKPSWVTFHHHCISLHHPCIPLSPFVFPLSSHYIPSVSLVHHQHIPISLGRKFLSIKTHFFGS
jgi:hypothetical protein